MTARIYQPTRSVTQSGRANRHWVLEFDQDGRREIDGLMGWTGSADTRAQISMKFSSRDEAVNFARKRGLNYDLQEPQARRVRPKSYTDNFIRKV
jgi:antibiotic biosynthesis monooxygenase (ABM) superfamily enzyme